MSLSKTDYSKPSNFLSLHVRTQRQQNKTQCTVIMKFMKHVVDNDPNICYCQFMRIRKKDTNRAIRKVTAYNQVPLLH